MIKTEGVTYLGPPWSGVESIFEAWGINVIETSFGLETLDFKDTSSFTVAFFESPLVRFCNAYIAAMSVLELEPHPDRFHDWLRDDWVPYYYEKNCRNHKPGLTFLDLLIGLNLIYCLNT